MICKRCGKRIYEEPSQRTVFMSGWFHVETHNFYCDPADTTNRLRAAKTQTNAAWLAVLEKEYEYGAIPLLKSDVAKEWL